MHRPRHTGCCSPSSLCIVAVAHVTLHLTHRITGLQACELGRAKRHIYSLTTALTTSTIMISMVMCHLPFLHCHEDWRHIKHARSRRTVSQFETNCNSYFHFTPSANMFPMFLPLTLFLLPLASLRAPLTTALPLPFAASIPTAHTCLTFDFPLEATNLKVSDWATCVLFSYVSHPPAAQQSPRTVPPSPKHHRRTLTHFFPKQRLILRWASDNILLIESTRPGRPQDHKSLLPSLQSLHNRRPIESKPRGRSKWAKKFP